MDRVTKEGQMTKYKVILADCPWKYSDKRKNDPGYAGITYDVMSTKDLCSLPVKEIADKDCMLFMWVTSPMLPDCLEIMKAWGFCCVPETPVLKKDLTWCNVGDINVGDELFAFDENTNKNGRRHYAFSKVLKKDTIKLNCYKVVMSNGDSIICSEDHQWLCRYRQKCGQTGTIRWIKTKDLLANYHGSRDGGSTEIIKLANVVHPETDYAAGFISASFDSEGSLNKTKPRICFSQKSNALLRTLMKYLDEKNVRYNTHKYGDLCHLDVQGGIKDGVLDFLQKFRPPRLLDNWDKYPLSNVSLYNLVGETVKEIIPVGVREVVMLETTSKTYIANGYASHNCYKTVAFVWEKLNTRSGTPVSLMGRFTMGSCEYVLVGVKGHPQRVSKNVRQLVQAKRAGHSVKPKDVHNRIVELCGDVPRVELFARDTVEGWDCIGNGIDGKDIRDVLEEKRNQE